MAHCAQQAETADYLWAHYARTGDPRTRDALVHQFERLAYSIANRYTRRGTDNEDLFQVAMIGLVKAVDRFDPSTNYRFVTFATPTILGEIRRYFRDHNWSVHVPRGIQELAGRVQRGRSELSERLGRTPTSEELAAHLEVSEEQVKQALGLDEVNHTLSLDGEFESADAGRATVLEQCLGREDRSLNDTEHRVGVQQALHQLPESLREVIRMRYLAELSQREVARRLNLSQMAVSRLEKRGLEELRAHFSLN